jgi:hypothetical protein
MMYVKFCIIFRDQGTLQSGQPVDNLDYNLGVLECFDWHRKFDSLVFKTQRSLHPRTLSKTYTLKPDHITSNPR